MPTPSCTCILAKPAGAMGLSTFHTALCMQHGACPEVGGPVEWKPTGLFFGMRAQQGAVITTVKSALSSATLVAKAPSTLLKTPSTC